MRRIYLLVLFNFLYSQFNQPLAILDSVINRMTPSNTKGIIKQVNKYPDKKERTFMYEYYSDNENNMQLVRYLAPKKVKNNAFLVKNNGNDIWAYFYRTRRVRKLASHLSKQGMQNSEFSFQDLGRNDDWLDEFNVFLDKDDTNIILRLESKIESKSDYTKMIISANRSDFFPFEIMYFNDDINEKTLTLSDIKMDQELVYAKTMKMKNNLTKAETLMIIEDIEFDIEFDKDTFNENKLKK